MNILKESINKLTQATIYSAFCAYSQFFGLTQEQEDKAWGNMVDLMKMDITLGLAMDTSIAMARW